jgi:hypothetical protein
MHSPDHHIEEAKHFQHAAHDPFDRNVTMTIAIVAAVLACVTMLSHRAHNDTLRYQAEANRIQTEAGRYNTQSNIFHTKASDAWSFYQAKNIRKYEFQSFLDSMKVNAKAEGTEEQSKKTMDFWSKKIANYEKELPVMMAEAKALVKKGEDAQKKAEEELAHSKEDLEKSHEAHARGDRFDLAELGVEMALVLCSLAVLTKRRSFWLTGMGIGSVGSLIALATYLGLFLPGGHH